MRKSFLLDANILLRDADAESVQHEIVRQALADLSRRDARLCIVAQSLFEFWAVATRPARNNGLGLTTDEAAYYVARYRTTFELLSEEPLLDQWQRLVVTYGVSSKPTHDARYIAAMKVHDIDHILTFNGSDFARFSVGERVSVVQPGEIEDIEYSISV